MHAGFVQDVTDTDHQTQNGSTLVTFQHEFLTNLTINLHTHTNLLFLNCCEHLLYSAPVDKACDMSLLGVPFNPASNADMGLLRNSKTFHCRSDSNSQHWSTTVFL